MDKAQIMETLQSIDGTLKRIETVLCAISKDRINIEKLTIEINKAIESISRTPQE